MKFNTTTLCEYCGKHRSAANHSLCSVKRKQATKGIQQNERTDNQKERTKRQDRNSSI